MQISAIIAIIILALSCSDVFYRFNIKLWSPFLLMDWHYDIVHAVEKAWNCIRAWQYIEWEAVITLALLRSCSDVFYKLLRFNIELWSPCACSIKIFANGLTFWHCACSWEGSELHKSLTIRWVGGCCIQYISIVQKLIEKSLQISE